MTPLHKQLIRDVLLSVQIINFHDRDFEKLACLRQAQPVFNGKAIKSFILNTTRFTAIMKNVIPYTFHERKGEEKLPQKS